MKKPINQGRTGEFQNFRRLRRKKKRTWLKVLISLLVVFSLAAAGGIFALTRLQTNIKTEPLNLGVDMAQADTGPQIPVDTTKGPLNVLVIGTDTRTNNTEYGGEDMSSGYGQSDVMILLHLSADKKSATALSFPRDMMAPIPSCKNPETGETSQALYQPQLNSSMNNGPGCTVAAINQMTGIRIDHMMVADFNSVKKLSDSIGGVEVCVNKAVNDPKSGLNIPSGTSSVQGEQALAFLRTRSAFGDGSDLGRIKAQQSFLASMARKITSEKTLTDLPKLYTIADTITQNLTVDNGLSSVGELLKVANRMREINVSAIQFITVPNMADPYDPNRVVLDETTAEPLFEAIANDEPVPTAEPTATPSATTEAALPALDRGLLDVDVTNRSGVQDRSERMQSALVALGYKSSDANPDDTVIPESQILYGYGFKEYADHLAADLGIGAAQVQLSEYSSSVSLVVGKDMALLNKLMEEPAAVQQDFQGQTAAQAPCQAVN